ncbi:MAG: MMPL family transporter [Bradymonadaceae bacterium]|nr:MMPL family transporter [Lujinxingiaceae bacterium]
MFRILADFILHYRVTLLASVAILFVASSALLPSLQFDFTPQQLFRSSHDDDRNAVYRESFAARFGREDNLIAVLVDGPDIFRPDVLATLRDLTFDLRYLEHIKDAQSVATVAIPRPGSEPGAMTVDPIVGDLLAGAGHDGLSRPVRGPPVEAALAEKLAELAGGEPLIAGRLASADRQTSLVLAWIGDEVQDINVLKAVVGALKESLTLYPLPEGYTYRVSGIPALRVEIVDNLRREQLTFIPMTGFVYLLVLLFLFRRPSGVLLPLGTVAFAVTATMAIMVLTDFPINIINNILPPLIFIIGISDSIHMLTRQAEEIEHGMSPIEATRSMIRHAGGACLLTTTTTAVGFLSLISADTEILKNFGWQAGLGVMLAYAGTLFFLPAALTYMRPARRVKFSATGDRQTPLLEKFLTGTGSSLLDRPWTVLTVSLLIALGFGVMGTRVNIDTTILEVFHESHPAHIATRHIEEKLGGILPVEISLEAKEFDHFKDPELVAKIYALQRFAQAKSEVLSTESFVDYHQATRAALLADPAERTRMPDSREQVEQLHLLLADAPDTQSGVGRFVTGDFRNVRVLLRVGDVGARRQLRLGDELNAELARLFGPESGVTYFLTGDAYVASAALNSFIHDLFYSLLMAIVVIFLMLTLVFRSIKLGLISLLPNSIPLIMTFGYMGIMGIDLNTSTVIIFAISLGIAVDDSIHFFARFKEEMAKTDDTREAILATYFGAGRAILLTSVMLLVGLIVLVMSDFMPTRQFAILTGITIFGAILADLFLLPVLLYLVYRREERS